ncbi:cell division protein FtsQ/DivIB [Promicromonospora sp. Populi]|uniref:cell division protein FtsQ/DivIB n=1 Tax=Promicromonospora sp. Populi TaxID=3239420 RepID=UPI0034E1CBF4
MAQHENDGPPAPGATARGPRTQDRSGRSTATARSAVPPPPPSPEQPPAPPAPPAAQRPAPASRLDTGRATPSGSRADVVSDQLADRLAERTAMARYRFWRRIGWGAVALACAAGLVWVTFFSPLLALDPEQVRVSGQGTTIDVEQVRTAATDQADVPLPRIDTVGLREEILAMNGVRDVEITRTWPDGLTVALTSREPVAAVPQPGDVYALMDTDGVRVGTVEDVPDGLPSIVLSLDDGEASRRAMDAALSVLGALPPELGADIRTVHAATQDDVRTTLSDGRVIRWGSGEQVELKTRVAQTLLEAEPSATTVDVSSPELPVTN